MTETPKTWSVYARRVHGNSDAFSGVNISIPESQIGFAGLDTRVTVTEDPDGDHLGWIPTGHEEEPPVMIQHEKIFDISFPYGADAAVASGNGQVIRLSVSACGP